MKREQHVRHLVVVAVQIGHRNFQDAGQANRHRVVGLVDANLVAIDSSRSDEFIESGSDSQILLAQAARKPRLLEPLGPDLVRFFDLIVDLHMSYEVRSFPRIKLLRSS